MMHDHTTPTTGPGRDQTSQSSRAVATDAGTIAAMPGELRAFLAAPRFATLATVDPDGTPHQAVVWYAIEGNTILVNSRRGRHWPANVERNTNVHLAVYDDSRPTHWIGLKGHGRFVPDGAEALEDIKSFARRYEDGDPDRFDGQERVTFAIEIDRWFEYGSRS